MPSVSMRPQGLRILPSTDRFSPTERDIADLHNGVVDDVNRSPILSWLWFQTGGFTTGVRAYVETAFPTSLETLCLMVAYIHHGEAPHARELLERHRHELGVWGGALEYEINLICRTLTHEELDTDLDHTADDLLRAYLWKNRALLHLQEASHVQRGNGEEEYGGGDLRTELSTQVRGLLAQAAAVFEKTSAFEAGRIHMIFSKNDGNLSRAIEHAEKALGQFRISQAAYYIRDADRRIQDCRIQLLVRQTTHQKYLALATHHLRPIDEAQNLDGLWEALLTVFSGRDIFAGCVSIVAKTTQTLIQKRIFPGHEREATEIYDIGPNYQAVISKSVPRNLVTTILDATVDKLNVFALRTDQETFCERIGNMAFYDRSMREELNVIRRVIAYKGQDKALLLLGEQGVGKTTLAYQIHLARGGKPGHFQVVSCNQFVNADMLKTILFGYKKGAYTGADKPDIGVFEAVGEGTVFLDEIGDLPLELQGLLFRSLEERTFQRVGEKTDRDIRCQIIAGTNLDLVKMSLEGKFRKELLGRFAAAARIKPLREMPNQIIPQATDILHQYAEKRRVPKCQLSDAAAVHLKRLDWYPDNSRELRRVLEWAAITLENQPPDAPRLITPELIEDARTTYRHLCPSIAAEETPKEASTVGSDSLAPASSEAPPGSAETHQADVDRFRRKYQSIYRFIVAKKLRTTLLPEETLRSLASQIASDKIRFFPSPKIFRALFHCFEKCAYLQRQDLNQLKEAYVKCRPLARDLFTE